MGRISDRKRGFVTNSRSFWKKKGISHRKRGMKIKPYIFRYKGQKMYGYKW